MEDENGIELTLGLSCGGSSANLKLKNTITAISRPDEGDKSSRIDENLKNSLLTGNWNQDSGQGFQPTDPPNAHDNFFNNLSRPTGDADTSTIGLWGTSCNRSIEAEEEKPARGLWVMNNHGSIGAEEEKPYQQEPFGKRKMSFDGLNNLKKHEKEPHDAHDKNSQKVILNSTKTSNLSIHADDGLAAENEDVAESEVEGATSRRELHGHNDSNFVNSQGQKRFGKPLESDFKIGTYGVAYAGQPLNIMNVMYPLPVKDSNSVGASSTPGYPRSGVTQLAHPNGERLRTQHLNSSNLPQTFGYSPVQLPMLDKEYSWSLGSNLQQFNPLHANKGTGSVAPNSDGDTDGFKLCQAPQRASELFAKGEGKLPASESIPSHPENGDRGGRNKIFKGKDASSEQPTTDLLPTEGLSIRPGIHAKVDFGGSGSVPDLPWVSTTSPGPNGKTISGVPYRFSANQIKIVCACHSSHMTPEEFAQHASEE